MGIENEHSSIKLLLLFCSIIFLRNLLNGMLIL